MAELERIANEEKEGELARQANELAEIARQESEIARQEQKEAEEAETNEDVPATEIIAEEPVEESNTDIVDEEPKINSETEEGTVQEDKEDEEE